MSDVNPWFALAAFLGLAANSGCHLLAAFCTNGSPVSRAILIGIVTGLLTTLALTAWSLSGTSWALAETLIAFAYNLVIYLALAFGYFNFVNLHIASLRLRILEELRTSPAGLTRAEIVSYYNAEELLNRRLARLTRGHYLVERDARYFYVPSVLLPLAHVLNCVKLWLLARPNRFLQAAADASNMQARSASKGEA